MELFVGVLIVCGIIFLVSKLGDLALNRGYFWLFLILSLIAGGLLMAAIRVATKVPVR